MVSDDGLRAAKEKMRAEGVADAAIATFEHYYEQLEAGESGLLPDAELEPLEDLPRRRACPTRPTRDALDRAVVIKLNGGLGTSMGMEQAKSLLEVKDGPQFLDIIVRQILELRAQHDARLPLVLMNSFSTREDTLAALEQLPGARRRRPARLPPEQGAEAPRRRPARRSSGRRPGARVVPARARRPLHGAA